MTQINTILNNICISLENKNPDKGNEALNGNAGHALFFFYYYKYSKKEVYYDKAISMLDEVIDVINNNNPNSAFFNGIAGIGWLVEHLSENDFVEIDTDSFFENTIDDYLHDSMLQLLYSNHFGFYGGSLGHCLYFVKRYQNTNSSKLKVKYKNYITEQIFFLERQRLSGLTGIKPFPYQNENIAGLYSPGLNEYLANVINFLSLLYSLNDFNPIIEPLLEDYASFILKNTNQKSNVKPYVALCLWKSGNILNRKEFGERAEEIFQTNLILGKSASINSYLRASLTYDFLFQKTNKPNYEKFKNDWLNKSLKTISSKGFENLNGGLWNGLSGVGLSLISLKRNFKTNWEECLLIDNKVK